MNCGIICEFNPFHNGHALLFKKLRQKGCHLIVAVMSGNFVQRGEPAIADKWLRAKCAIENGADLVFELPAVFCLQSAEGFAFGGISLLKRLGIVDAFGFGSESADLVALEQTALYLSNFDSKKIDKKLNYAQALEKALENDFPSGAQIIKNPNDILAVEYLKANSSIGTPLTPLCIKREDVLHDAKSPLGNIASASFLRSLWKKEGFSHCTSFIPTAPLLNPEEKRAADFSRLFLLCLEKLRQMDPIRLENFSGLKDGLGSRFLKAARQATSLEELLLSAKTKSCHYSRLKRSLCQILLDIYEKDLKMAKKTGPLYARLLGASPKGLPFLSKIKENSALPLLTKLTGFLPEEAYLAAKDLSAEQKMLLFDLRATEMQALCYEPPTLKGRDYLYSPYFFK